MSQSKPLPQRVLALFLLVLIAMTTGLPSRAQDDSSQSREERRRNLMPVDCNEKLQPVQKESCDQCKFLPCLKDTVAQKRKLVAVYEGIKNFWLNRHLDDQNKPVLIRQLSSMKEPERSRVYVTTMTQLEQYKAMESARTERVGSAQSCFYPGDRDLTVSTDVFETCRTCIGELNRAMQAQPCQELADLISAHEAMHSRNCKDRQKQEYWQFTAVGDKGRKQSKYLPASILTPAGKAAEEVAAYQEEIAALESLIRGLEKRCKPRRHPSSGGDEPSEDDSQARRNPASPPAIKVKPIAPPPPHTIKPLPKIPQ